MTAVQIARIVHEAGRAYSQSIDDNSDFPDVDWEMLHPLEQEALVEAVDDVMTGAVTSPEEFGPPERPFSDYTPMEQFSVHIIFEVVRACQMSTDPDSSNESPLYDWGGEDYPSLMESESPDETAAEEDSQRLGLEPPLPFDPEEE
jgi:hypothetical protein